MKKSSILVTVALAAAIAGAKDVDVRDFGAKGDGVTFDTEAVQKAIDDCSAAGGGRVTLAGGTFLVKPIHDSPVGINIWFVPQNWNAAGDWGREKTRIENITFSDIVMDRIHSYPVTTSSPRRRGRRRNRLRSTSPARTRSCTAGTSASTGLRSTRASDRRGTS